MDFLLDFVVSIPFKFLSSYFRESLKKPAFALHYAIRPENLLDSLK